MRRTTATAFLLFVACLPSVLWASNPSGVGRFSKLVPGTQKEIPISSATLKDKVYFRIDFAADNGDHTLRVNVYDGNGNQVLDAESLLVVRNGMAGKAVSYGFDTMNDAPGIWWYVAALDGKVVVSNSLTVTK